MSKTDYATAEDFERWEEKAKSMDYESLTWCVHDAFDAACAVEEHNPVLAGRYRDEANTYLRELTRRDVAKYS